MCFGYFFQVRSLYVPIITAGYLCGVCFRESLDFRLYSEIDQINLSIEAQCGTVCLPMGDCHIHNRILLKDCCNVFTCGISITCLIYPGNFFGQQRPTALPSASAGPFRQPVRACNGWSGQQQPVKASNGRSGPAIGLCQSSQPHYLLLAPASSASSLSPSGPCRPHRSLTAQAASLPPSGPCRPSQPITNTSFIFVIIVSLCQTSCPLRTVHYRLC